MEKDIKDITKTELEQKGLDKGYFRVFLQKKLEKITSAVHLLTSNSGSEEPIRLSLRKISLEILSLSFINMGEIGATLILKIEELRTLLQVSRNTQIISEMNYTVLDKELKEILNQIHSGNFVTGENLSPHSFAVSKRDITAEIPATSNFIEDEIETDKMYKSTQPSSKTISNKTHFESDRALRDNLKKNGKKKARRDQILDILKDKGETNIKDISFHVGGVSEKTIQRDLNLLIRKGVVSRMGEKRWSTYVLSGE
jgi:DNA-binding transcriptional ArsR family regulator